MSDVEGDEPMAAAAGKILDYFLRFRNFFHLNPLICRNSGEKWTFVIKLEDFVKFIIYNSFSFSCCRNRWCL